MFKKLLKNVKINKLSQFLISALVINGRGKRKLKNEVKSIYRNYKKTEIAHLIANKYPDYYCIFSRYGIGDIFFIASLIKAFKQKNDGVKIAYFTEKKRLVKFLKAFPSIDEVVFDKDIKFLQEEQTLQQNLQRGKLNKLFFPYRGAKETYTFADNYNNLLDLPLDTKRELPVITKENYNKASEEFKKLRLNPEKTVLLIPDATMFNYRLVDISFWKNLSNKLNIKGYQTVFNCNIKDFKKFKNTFLPIMDFVAFANQVNYIVSFRSGISDLLAGMNMFNMSVIYPPNLEVIWADAVVFHDLHKRHVHKYNTEFENIFSIHSLNSTYKINKIDEIIYDYNDEKIIEHIISSVQIN